MDCEYCGFFCFEFGVFLLFVLVKGGRECVGWVNGNFFMVFWGVNCFCGVWEFMKFWSGFGGNEVEVVMICV